MERGMWPMGTWSVSSWMRASWNFRKREPRLCRKSWPLRLLRRHSSLGHSGSGMKTCVVISW
jgi:hypothetical protein